MLDGSMILSKTDRGAAIKITKTSDKTICRKESSFDRAIIRPIFNRAS